MCDRFLWIMTVMKWRRLLFPPFIYFSIHIQLHTRHKYAYKNIGMLFFIDAQHTTFISLKHSSCYSDRAMIRSLLPFYVIFIFTLENVTLTSMTVCLLSEKQALCFFVDVAYTRNRDGIILLWWCVYVCYIMTQTRLKCIVYKIHMCFFPFVEFVDVKEPNICSLFSLRFFWSAECEMLFTWRTTGLCYLSIQSKRNNTTQ